MPYFKIENNFFIFDDIFYKRADVTELRGWERMLEPYSDEEKKYIMYLVKKYLPGFGIQEGRDGTTVMYEQNAKTKNNDQIEQ